MDLDPSPISKNWCSVRAHTGTLERVTAGFGREGCLTRENKTESATNTNGGCEWEATVERK
jgi:hypothetical protein